MDKSAGAIRTGMPSRIRNEFIDNKSYKNRAIPCNLNFVWRVKLNFAGSDCGSRSISRK